MERRNYVIASHNAGDNVCFYLEEAGSEYRFGKVTNAIRFTYDEVLNFMKEHKGAFSMGFTVVEIMDCTWKLLEEVDNQGFEAKANSNLWKNYHNFLEVAR